MSEWYCPICHRLNTSDSGTAGEAPICHSCHFSWSYHDDLNEALREKSSLHEYIQDTEVWLGISQDKISELESEIRRHPEKKECHQNELSQLMRDEENDRNSLDRMNIELGRIQNRIKELREIDSLAKTFIENHTVRRSTAAASDICQKSLEVFI